ncbi:MAG TPA: hypothetical protein VH165_24555 [Kofleriaceae bacterium]|nr:hypothetical protein [Kofleriaceae bacterium]
MIGLGLALAACKKDGAGASGGGDEDLSLLPVDSELVLGINVEQVQQSALWKQFVEPKILASSDTTKKMAEFKAKCGFDPMTAVKSMSIGLKGLSDKPTGTVVVHGLDKGKIWSCLDTMKDEIKSDGTEFTRDGDVAIFKNSKVNETYAVTFINDSTLIAVIGDQATPDGVKAAAAGKSALRTSPQFVEMYKKVKTSDSLWGLMNGNSKAFDKMGSLGIKPKAMFGSLNVTDGLAVDLQMRLETPDAATSLATLAKGQLDQAKTMVDKAEVTSEGTDVKFTIVMSSQKLQSLLQQFGPMLGGMAH